MAKTVSKIHQCSHGCQCGVQELFLQLVAVRCSHCARPPKEGALCLQCGAFMCAADPKCRNPKGGGHCKAHALACGTSQPSSPSSSSSCSSQPYVTSAAACDQLWLLSTDHSNAKTQTCPFKQCSSRCHCALARGTSSRVGDEPCRSPPPQSSLSLCCNAYNNMHVEALTLRDSSACLVTGMQHFTNLSDTCCLAEAHSTWGLQQLYLCLLV